MNIKRVLLMASFLSFSTPYANDLGLTEEQLNSILKTETVTPVVTEALTPQREKVKKTSVTDLNGKFLTLTGYVERSIRNIKPVITGGYLGSLEKERKNAYPKALKEIGNDCKNLSLRASDMKKDKISSVALKKLKEDISKYCYIKVLKLFKQDIPKVKEYLKWEKERTEG